MNPDLEDLASRVENIERMVGELSNFNGDECIKKISVSLESVLNNRARDNKLNILILLFTILIVLTLFFGTYTIYTLYELAS